MGGWGRGEGAVKSRDEVEAARKGRQHVNTGRRRQRSGWYGQGPKTSWREARHVSPPPPPGPTCRPPPRLPPPPAHTHPYRPPPPPPPPRPHAPIVRQQYGSVVPAVADVAAHGLIHGAHGLCVWGGGGGCCGGCCWGVVHPKLTNQVKLAGAGRGLFPPFGVCGAGGGEGCSRWRALTKTCTSAFEHQHAARSVPLPLPPPLSLSRSLSLSPAPSSPLPHRVGVPGLPGEAAHALAQQ